jgi:drug/metabolite transporter (DMT)-like permease
VRTAPISIVAPFRYAAMIWALLLGYVFWRTIPDRPAQLGIALIAAAGLYTFHRERKLYGARPSSTSA